MSRSMGKGVFWAVAILLLLAGPAWAQNREAAWEVMPYLNYVSFGSETSITAVPGPNDQAVAEVDNSTGYGFRFGYHWTKRHLIEFGFSGTSTSGVVTLDKAVSGPPPSRVVKVGDYDSDYFAGQVNYVYNIFLHRRDKIVAFVTGGVGLINIGSFGQAGDPDIQNVLDLIVGDETDFLYDYGAGIRFFGGEKAGVRIEARQVRYSTDLGGNQNYIEFGVGLTFVLGGA